MTGAPSAPDPMIDVHRSKRPTVGDAVFGAAHEVWEIVRQSVTDPGPWSYAGVAILAMIGIGVLVRGKLASPWLLLPAFAGAAYWGWRHFGR